MLVQSVDQMSRSHDVDNREFAVHSRVMAEREMARVNWLALCTNSGGATEHVSRRLEHANTSVASKIFDLQYRYRLKVAETKRS
jgi:hypothetical protein